MKKLYKNYILLMLVFFMTFSLSACGSGTNKQSSVDIGKRTVKIGYLPITHAVPLYIEKEMEQYKGFNLELVKFGSWPELMDALNTGRIDGASVLVTLAMKAKEQGIDLSAVALGHRDGNVFVVGNDVNSAEDLKGKNFAIPHKFSTHNILLYQMLKQNGLKYEDVKAIEMPPAEMPAALSEGRIAGYVVAEPFGAISVSIDKGKVLFQDQDIWKDSIDCTLVLRNDFIKKESKIAQEFVNQYVRAGEMAELKDEHTHEMSSKYMKVEKDVLDLSFQWISYDDLKIKEEEYEELRNNLKEMGLMENPPAYSEFVDHSLIDKAK
ncbi:MAG: ABC transporter substrate-binding protein [Mesobacillus sp.]|uniref:ABC transporter substrate-binding protein n=1 Tax=Mesobacillus sp. TaxID=2675271 RepID=UPI003C4AE9F5